MRVAFLITVSVLILSACTSTSLGVSTFRPDSAIACKSPIFVKTAYKASAEGGLDLTIYQLTRDAQNNFGSDVSIQNVNWDVKQGVRISVTYDIIRCNPDTLGTK